MKYKYLSIRLIVGVIFILLSLISNAFAGDVSVSKRQLSQSSLSTNSGYVSVKVPKNTRYFIAADKNGKTLLFQGIDENGRLEKSKACAVCTVELSNNYGSFCEKLRGNKDLRKRVLTKTIGKQYANLSFCAGTNKVEFLGVKRNDVIFTRMNPICLSKIEVAGSVIYSLPPGCAG